MSARVPIVLFADLGPQAAVLTALVGGRPVAVVNAAVRDDPDVRQAAIDGITAAGYDSAPLLRDLLHGVRS